MFERIKSFFRKAVTNIVGTAELFEALEITIPTSQQMQDAIKLWASMHENRAPWLSPPQEYRSLGIPALIVKEESRLATIELNVKLSGSERADFLDATMQQVLRQKEVDTEFACARGDLIFKPYIGQNTIAVDHVKAGDHISLAFDSNGDSTSELFLDWRIIGEYMYVRGEVQKFTGDSVEITNKVVYTSKNRTKYYPASLSDVDDWKNIAPSATITDVTRPLWGLFKMPFANTVDTSSPLGVSSFAGAVTQIEDADMQYTNLLWEMDSGKRKIITDETAREWDAHGNLLPVQNEFIMGINNGDEKLFQDYSADFRDISIINALHFILSRIEGNSGLSQGAITKILTGQARTATEVLSLEHETRSTVESIRTAFETALRQLIYAMDVWATVANNEGYFSVPPGKVDSLIEFGDGVVLSEDEQYKRVNNAVASGNVKPQYLIPFLKLQPMPPEQLAELQQQFMPELADVE